MQTLANEIKKISCPYLRLTLLLNFYPNATIPKREQRIRQRIVEEIGIKSR